MTAARNRRRAPRVGAVVIGRNEGARLDACLASVRAAGLPVVYVDSGSTDGSPDRARAAGAAVIELPPDRPFTAARGRNAGATFLLAGTDAPEIILFIDGDCTLDPDWPETAARALADDPSLALVTGWRREVRADASIYNDLCAVEWHRPAGDIEACGGDMAVRSAAFAAVGGFDEQVIAAEDDEFCTRLRKAGWRLVRLPVQMTTHDAAMTRFAQWWMRAVRSGHGFAQVGALHPEHFRAERRRVQLFGLVGPMLVAVYAVVWPSGLWLLSAFYAASYVRSFSGRRAEGLGAARAARHAGFLVLSKFPNAIGMVTYWLRRARQRPYRLIEYK